jgi:putative toxin-antitoxin system antitoxin component (TIGR02293 family)
VSDIEALAKDVFEDVEKAYRWLREPLGILDGRTPLEVSQTEAGARLVERLLGNLAWGGAA